MALIQRISLAAEVASRLQEQILKGTYGLNQKLPVEQKLMDYFGVGRSTIREAVKILANSGYVRVQQGLGTFVEDDSGANENMYQLLKRSDPSHVHEVRLILEMKMAEKAAQNRDANDVAKMEHYLAKKTKALDANAPAQFIEAHIQFYQAMAKASKNTMLIDLYKSFAKQMKIDMEALYSETVPTNVPTDMHVKLVESIMRQDPNRAWYWSAKITGQLIV